MSPRAQSTPPSRPARSTRPARSAVARQAAIPAQLQRLLDLLPRRVTLAGALTVSLFLHALLLAVHFEVPQRLHQASAQMLDIILVNARSTTAPDAAQARAQANLDGGGNSDLERIASTPLPATRDQRPGDALQAAQQKVAHMEKLQRELLQQLHSQQIPASNTPAAAAPETDNTKGSDLASSALAMARLQGRIDQQTEAYNKRPRKKYLGARTSEYRFAQYEEDWRQKIERIGNLNYPEAAKGKAYGTLVLTVEISADGNIAAISIDRSSGKPVLDAAAKRIVQMAAPFPVFPPNLADVDIIGITRTWSFTRDDRLQAN